MSGMISAAAEGEPMGTAGSHGSKKGELWCPQGAAFAKSSNALFVADYVNGRVVVYDTNTMEHMRTFGERFRTPSVA